MKFYVYKLYNEKGIYYGKTNNIKCRMSKHRSLNNNCSSKILFNEEDNVKIDILNTFDNEEDASICELKYIKDNFNNCVNKNVPRQTAHEHYINNRERLLEDKKTRIICECGCEVSKRHLSRHRRTLKHRNFIHDINNNNNNI